MSFVGVDALESCVYCSNVGSFEFIEQDVVLLFADAFEHDPHLLDEFHIEYSSI